MGGARIFAVWGQHAHRTVPKMDISSVKSRIPMWGRAGRRAQGRAAAPASCHATQALTADRAIRTGPV